MTSLFKEHPEATAELRDAIRWYSSRQWGLGDDMLACVDRALDDICDTPESWPVYPGWDEQPIVRTHGIKKYPYRVAYYLDDDHIVIVIAYAHTSRQPGYWRPRVDTDFMAL